MPEKENGPRSEREPLIAALRRVSDGTGREAWCHPTRHPAIFQAHSLVPDSRRKSALTGLDPKMIGEVRCSRTSTRPVLASVVKELRATFLCGLQRANAREKMSGRVPERCL